MTYCNTTDCTILWILLEYSSGIWLEGITEIFHEFFLESSSNNSWNIAIPRFARSCEYYWNIPVEYYWKALLKYFTRSSWNLPVIIHEILQYHGLHDLVNITGIFQWNLTGRHSWNFHKFFLESSSNNSWNIVIPRIARSCAYYWNMPVEYYWKALLKYFTIFFVIFQ